MLLRCLHRKNHLSGGTSLNNRTRNPDPLRVSGRSVRPVQRLQDSLTVTLCHNRRVAVSVEVLDTPPVRQDRLTRQVPSVGELRQARVASDRGVPNVREEVVEHGVGPVRVRHVGRSKTVLELLASIGGDVLGPCPTKVTDFLDRGKVLSSQHRVAHLSLGPGSVTGRRVVNLVAVNHVLGSGGQVHVVGDASCGGLTGDLGGDSTHSHRVVRHSGCWDGVSGPDDSSTTSAIVVGYRLNSCAR